MGNLQLPITKTVRKVQQLGWTTAGTKALEAVEQTRGETTNYYFQVTHVGKEIFQTVTLKDAQDKYNSLK
jgi:hypothetical protein